MKKPILTSAAIAHKLAKISSKAELTQLCLEASRSYTEISLRLTSLGKGTGKRALYQGEERKLSILLEAIKLKVQLKDCTPVCFTFFEVSDHD